jgi:AcrR family transcriptional regulator
MKSGMRQLYKMVARAEGMATTRERIVEATLKLALERDFEGITLIAIAEAAGVSHQTVLNHFESKENVLAAAAELLSRQTRSAREKATPGDHAGAVSILVGEYERFGDPGARWAMESDRLGSLAPMLDEARAGHQTWLKHTFADQLPQAPIARRRAIHALHAATDVYTWKLLRRDLRLTRAETERIMLDLINGILDDSTAARRGQRSRRNR